MCLILLVSTLIFTACGDKVTPETNNQQETTSNSDQTTPSASEETTPAPHLHAEIIDKAIAPTCTETGLTEGKHCSACNEVLVKQETIKAFGHSYSSTVTSPAATTDVYITYTCSTCDNSYTKTITATNFIITDSNRADVGYTGEVDEHLIIPAVFEKNGVWYKVTGISGGAFSFCTNLMSITIPDSVTSIGKGAFVGCINLVDITLPFVGTSIKTEIDIYQYPFGIIFGTDNYMGSIKTEQYYHSSTTNTTSSIYYIPASLKSVTITGGNILYGAFYNCNGLTNITLPDSVAVICDSAFYSCTSLTSIAIPKSVTIIGRQAFGNCTALTNVTIPDSVKSIDNFAFQRCSSLTNIKISNNVTDIGVYTFGHCTSLTNITIPDSVTIIYGRAFCGCTAMINITIPDSVTSIDDFAFEGCTALTSVRFEGTVAQWNAIAKGEKWEKYFLANQVICSDGVITLN